MKRTKQSLIDDKWTYVGTSKTNLEIWYRETGFEDNIQYIRWNPKTEEYYGLETTTIEQLQLLRGIWESIMFHKLGYDKLGCER